MNEQEQQIQGIPPQPVPTNFDLGIQTMADGVKLVRLAISTPSGIMVVFLAAQAAEQLAGALAATASKCSVIEIAHVVPPTDMFGNGHPRR